MEHRHACDAIVGNPQLFGRVLAIVKLYYRKNRERVHDAGLDCDDLEQELMLKLCEEPVRASDCHYLRLARSRLKNIVRDIAGPKFIDPDDEVADDRPPNEFAQ